MIRFTVVDRLVRLAMAALSPKECVYMMYILGIRNGVHPGGGYIVGGSETETETDLRTRDVVMGVEEGVFELPDSERQVQAPNGGGNITALLNNAAVNAIGSFRIQQEDMSYAQWRNEADIPAPAPPYQPIMRSSYPSPSEQPVGQEEPDWLARAYDTGAAPQAVADQVETRVYAEMTTAGILRPSEAVSEDTRSTSVPSRAESTRAILDIETRLADSPTVPFTLDDMMDAQRTLHEAAEERRINTAVSTPQVRWTEEDEQLFRRIQDARREEAQHRMYGISVSTEQAPRSYRMLNTDYNNRRR